MGLTIRDMLETNFFKRFKLLAGKEGLDKEVQGVTTLDAPDGYNWTQGKEFVISSGYVFREVEGSLMKYGESKNFEEISGFAIKLGRYLDEMPKEFIDKCNEKKIPLFSIPLDVPWMTIMNELNVIVMNNAIKRFNISDVDKSSLSERPYQELKINRILSQIEKEMRFPAMIYDIVNDKKYFSSNNFLNLSDEYIKLNDFWEPSFEHSKEILCDTLKITRYRFVEKERYKNPYSWITIPINVGEKIEAYFVILEAEDLIDYFDQFVLRISFILIQSSYEQILLAEKYDIKEFRKLVYDLLYERLPNDEVKTERIEDAGIGIHEEFYLLLIENNKSLDFHDIALDLESAYSNTLKILGGKLTIMDEDYCLIIVKKDDEEDSLKLIELKIADMKKRLENKYKDLDMRFGISDIPFKIFNLKEAYERASKTLKIGNLVYKDRYYNKYSELGVFAWLDIKEDETDMMLEDIKELLKEENKELLKTLKVYLEENLNYSHTAEKLFIHINTVRKRIFEIEEMIDYDISDPMKRIKLEVMLKLIV